jgi:hypothetical protein
MTVLIDPPSWPARGRLWSHLASDRSVEELRAFARALGVPDRGFEGDHYDLPAESYAAAVEAGAVPVPTRELLRRLREAGLRRPKRRGEIVIVSLALGDGARIDTLVSSRPPRRSPACVVLLAASRVAGRVVVLPDGGLPTTVAGGDAVRAGAGLAAAVLHTGSGPPAVRQLGYLRYEGADPADRRVDVVLAVDVEVSQRLLPPAGWASAQAVAAARPSLAPLVSLALGQASG